MNDKDRISQRANRLPRKESARLRAASFPAGKCGRDKLPQRISEQIANGAALTKATKGLAPKPVDKTLNTNVRGLLFAVQKALPLRPVSALSLWWP